MAGKMKNGGARRLSFILAVLGGAFAAVGLGMAHAGSQNHLAGSTSAYLQQAVNEPVNWYPWNAAAWQKARQLDRPVLLDVGAVWCTWCTLMERESYADPALAGYINSHFVAIKVDYDADPKFSARLERAQAVLNLPAGLPLTGFATPDGKLFSGGAYFPAKAAPGKPALREVLEQAAQKFARERDALEREGFDLKPGENR